MMKAIVKMMIVLSLLINISCDYLSESKCGDDWAERESRHKDSLLVGTWEPKEFKDREIFYAFYEMGNWIDRQVRIDEYVQNNREEFINWFKTDDPNNWGTERWYTQGDELWIFSCGLKISRSEKKYARYKIINTDTLILYGTHNSDTLLRLK